MERYYRKSDSRTGPYPRLGGMPHNQDVYNPTPIRMPYAIDNRSFYQQETALPGNLFLQHNVNTTSRIHDMATPDLTLYAPAIPVRPVPHFPNNCVEYQEPSTYNECGQDFTFLPHNSKMTKYSNVTYDEDRFQNIPKQENINDGNNSRIVRDNNAATCGASGNSVFTHQDVAGCAVTGRSGSTPEIAAHPCTGSKSVCDVSQSRENQGKMSLCDLTREKNVENTSFKDKSLVKDANNKQKGLHASGMRIFTGSVEKVMKWHKSLSDTGVDIMYDVIARCVSLRPGKGCQKLLLLRDASGPVLQATYYEIDFLLPDVQPGSTLRIVGKMVGSNRLVAFKVREAAPGEVSSLPRLCAISQHMVTKLLNVK